MNILIAGGSGLLGASLYKDFLKCGFNVKKIGRVEGEGTFFDYDKIGACAPNLATKYDVVVNCAYNYNDRTLSDENINFVMVKNLLALTKRNGIPKFINISSMSAYEGCKSDYGKVKLRIEEEVAKAGGCSFRLGLFESDELVGLIKTVYMLSKLTPLVSIGVGRAYLPQYITNLNKFSLLLTSYIKDNSLYPDSIYSAVNSLPLDFNDIVSAVTNKPVFKIPLGILKMAIFLYELTPLPPVRFNSDSLKGLIFANDNPKNLIALENF